MAKAIYPGTFDPITNGHLDIIERAHKLFEQVHVVVAINSRKKTLFSLEEREELVLKSISEWPNVSVSRFEGLTVECVHRLGAQVLIRGLRQVSDFEYEFQMALMNRKLDASVETVHLMSSEKYTYLNSSIVRELVSLGADVSDFVPSHVEERLRIKVKAVGT